MLVSVEASRHPERLKRPTGSAACKGHICLTHAAAESQHKQIDLDSQLYESKLHIQGILIGPPRLLTAIR